MATPQFRLTPEKEASRSQWLHRQFLGKTPPLTKNDVDLTGKTAIVTGSNTGLGLETAGHLLDLGLTRLILAVRTVSKGERAREGLLAKRDPASCQIDVWNIDMSSYDSITEFVERAKTLDRLDIAVLNAGHFKELETFNSSTGYEECIQINYLSTMLLTILLLPLLKANPGAHPGRLVIVSSDMAAWAKFTERTERPILAAYKKKAAKWDMGERYATSKLLGQLFITKLADQIPASAVIVDLVNPGLCYGTDLARDGDGRLKGLLFKAAFRTFGKAPAIGALAIVHAAVSFDESAHGQYTEDGELRPLAPIIYKQEGKELTNQVWEETLAELSFAPIHESLKAFDK
ncbi:short-chain dehydrogenase, putative [Talaromyces stipitatus ATCC 10500]|uniref:Short-chain dehydrogenase, putative n=1 Tax=Talaromyces stipitatus (strain ATCC 10500 / CBS 375.48 / QM 6759 / NRRL 1006) TaxID=441959 RepID=B8M0H2_TALSN|nr:short-chain dehydrogenase, putative [Talaromyces stipitatus ATCC 10500]EED21269.1 short-chain dehydrogenase, putative [Talaromyces stipitatus ATCC 10500]